MWVMILTNETCKLFFKCPAGACLRPHFQRGTSRPLLQRQLTLQRLPLRLCTRNSSIGLLHTSTVRDPALMHMCAHVQPHVQHCLRLYILPPVFGLCVVLHGALNLHTLTCMLSEPTDDSLGCRWCDGTTNAVAKRACASS
jgi:hypothetical protein